MKIGTQEVRSPNQAGSVTSPIALREQQNCEICHKKNRGEAMLLCDGCDCGKFRKCAICTAFDDFQDFIRSALIHRSNRSRKNNGFATLVLIAVATMASMKAKSTVCQVSRLATSNSENCGLRPIRHQNVIFLLKRAISPKVALAVFLCQNTTSRRNSGV